MNTKYPMEMGENMKEFVHPDKVHLIFTDILKKKLVNTPKFNEVYKCCETEARYFSTIFNHSAPICVWRNCPIDYNKQQTIGFGTCPKCCTVNYCSAECQNLDWNAGHSEMCANLDKCAKTFCGNIVRMDKLREAFLKEGVHYYDLARIILFVSEGVEAQEAALPSIGNVHALKGLLQKKKIELKLIDDDKLDDELTVEQKETHEYYHYIDVISKCHEMMHQLPVVIAAYTYRDGKFNQEAVYTTGLKKGNKISKEQIELSKKNVPYSISQILKNTRRIY